MEPQRGGGSRTEVFLAESVVDRPLVFHHIRKTAGTSLTRILRQHLVASERIELRSPAGQAHPPLADIPGWYTEQLASLGGERTRRICCVISHSANYTLPLLPGHP